MMHGYGLDVAGAFVERIDEADIAVPAQPEHVWHFLAHQIIDDHLTAVEHVAWHFETVLCCRPSTAGESGPPKAVWWGKRGIIPA